MIKKIKTDAYTLNMMHTEKFKSTRVHISFAGPFVEEEVTERALLPYIIKAGSKNHPTRKDVTTYLENMYSAYFIPSVEKIGDTHIVYFDLSIIDDLYTLDNEPLLQQGLEFLHDMIVHPLLLEKSFVEEKRLIEEYFTSIYSNKGSYNMKLLRESMFANEHYKTGTLGSESFLPSITLDDVVREYNKMIDTNQITITVVGNIDFDEVQKVIDSTFTFKKRTIELAYNDYQSKELKEVTKLVEIQKVSQAKLALGYRLPIYYGDELYHPAIICSTLLGEGAESLLHLKVREELGLCYFIGSSYGSHKGIAYISAGIDASKEDLVIQEINNMIQRIIDQDYDEAFLDIAIKQNCAAVLGSLDSNSNIATRLERMSFYNQEFDIEAKLNAYKSVTKDQISEVAKMYQLDTISVLKGE